jgi:hypothetical protein
MHITPTPNPPSMSIARVREIVQELGDATASGLVAYFNREQLVDLLADIDRRVPLTPAGAAPQIADLPAITAYSKHVASCDRCHKGGGNRCDAGGQLYGAACAALLDQARLLF